MAPPLNRRALLVSASAALVLAGGAAVLVPVASPALLPWTLDPTDPRVSLEDVEREVIRRYPVPEIPVATLATMLARGTVTLFDVRTQAEFDAGHLPGAVRIEPGTTAEAILAQHRHRLDAGPVVFYCAVGVRSSQAMVATLRKIAPLAGGGVYNLRGGIFRWTAEGHALATQAGPGQPHPYDARWGRLLQRITAP
jgi:rhodanese-related sulfurtransferase